MALGINVKGGTHAGWRKLNEPGINRCACGGFISRQRHAEGKTVCLRCERAEGGTA